MSSSAPAIGFIGLGSMGAPMVARLVAAGHSLTVLDADAERTAACADETGAAAGCDAADVAARSDIVITMLPSSAVVEAVLDGPAGLLAGFKPGSLVLDMSSGVPETTRRLAERASGRGGALLDAPVSGGVSRARTGDLTIMVGGGTDAEFATASPVLRSLGTTITRTGPVGSAHAMKALNNLVSAGGFLIGIEALLIGARFGLDPALMVDVLNASTGMNNSTQKKFKQFVVSRRFDAGFSLDLMVKDLGIALGVAHDTGTTAPFASLCRDLWSGAQRYLGPGQDHTAMARFSELLAGQTLNAVPADPA